MAVRPAAGSRGLGIAGPVVPLMGAGRTVDDRWAGYPTHGARCSSSAFRGLPKLILGAPWLMCGPPCGRHLSPGGPQRDRPLLASAQAQRGASLQALGPLPYHHWAPWRCVWRCVGVGGGGRGLQGGASCHVRFAVRSANSDGCAARAARPAGGAAGMVFKMPPGPSDEVFTVELGKSASLPGRQPGQDRLTRASRPALARRAKVDQARDGK